MNININSLWLLTIIMIVLNVFGVGIPWLWVFAPLWLPIAILFSIVLLFGLIFLIVGLGVLVVAMFESFRR